VHHRPAAVHQHPLAGFFAFGLRTANPAAFTLSRTLLASARVWRLDVPLATMTRSNRLVSSSVLNTSMSWALTSSRASTMVRCSLRISMLMSAL
jgi:hypothetical protein